MFSIILFGSFAAAAFFVSLRSAARSGSPIWTRRLTILSVGTMGLAALQSIVSGGVLVDAPVWGAFYLSLAALAGEDAPPEHTTIGALTITGAILAIAALSLAPGDVVSAVASGSGDDAYDVLAGVKVIPAADALLALLTVAGVAAARRVPRLGLAAPFVALPLLGALYPDALRGLAPWANAVLATGLLLLWSSRDSGPTLDSGDPSPA